jgi:hypothetical protein
MTAAEYGFDPEILGMPPVYTLNLSAAQRSTLEWLTSHGALFAEIAVDVQQVAQECAASASTVADALARLTALRLVDHPDPTRYRVNPRYFFAINPEIRRLVGEAMDAPEIVPDARAEAPRKVGNTASRRRRTIRAVPDDS